MSQRTTERQPTNNKQHYAQDRRDTFIQVDL